MAESLRIEFEDIEKIELIGGYKARTLINAVSGYSRKPDYVFNATHFVNSSKDKNYGLTISDTIVNERLINGGNYNTGIYTDCGIAFNSNGEMEMCSTKTAQDKGYQSFIGGSPHLLENWVINDADLKTGFAKTPAIRIAMGFNDKEIILLFEKTRRSLKTVAQKIKDMGAKYAIALDGGGSLNVQKFENGRYIHIDELNYNRAVSTYVCIWLKKKKPIVNNKDVPEFNGQKALGVVEIKWDTVNRRVGAGTQYADIGTLKKGDRVTIFEQKGTWGKSYGYWFSLNSAKWVNRY